MQDKKTHLIAPDKKLGYCFRGAQIREGCDVSMTVTDEEIIDLLEKEAEEKRAARKAKHWRGIALWMGVAVLTFVLDQLSKWGVTEYVIRPAARGVSKESLGLWDWYFNQPSILPYTEIKITSFFNLVMVWNTGVSFGMLGDAGPYAPYILIALALAIVVLFTVWLVDAKSSFHRLCYALVIGGALGNIIDRLRFGAVIDFLDFHVADMHWPAFNVADSAVVMGIGGLILVLGLQDFLHRKSLKGKLNQRLAQKRRH